MVTILRPEDDIFRLADAGIATTVINPVSELGLNVSGLTGAVVNRFPKSYPPYLAKVIGKTAKVGEIIPYTDAESGIAVLYLPTRKETYDLTSEDDIRVCARAIGAYMTEHDCDIVTPVIGCGGKYDYLDMALKAMREELHAHPRIAHLCVRSSVGIDRHVFGNDPTVTIADLPETKSAYRQVVIVPAIDTSLGATDDLSVAILRPSSPSDRERILTIMADFLGQSWPVPLKED